jgi:hypothetical protein
LNILKIYFDDLNLFESAERTDQFITTLVPALIKLLNNSGVSFSKDLKNEIRSISLQLLNRIPISRKFDSCVNQLIGMIINVVQTDNETNAILSLQFLLQVCKVYFADIQQHLVTFLQFISSCYSNLMASAGKSYQKGMNSSGLLSKSTESLKFLAESSLIISFIFNSKTEMLMDSVLSLLHVMVLSLKMELNYSELIRLNKNFSLDLLDLQIRTLDCLHSVQHGDVLELIKIQGPEISSACISFLIECPQEAGEQRKKLMNAIRQAFKTELKRSYFKHIDFLISDKELVGKDAINNEVYKSNVNFLIGDIVKSMKGEFLAPHLVDLVQFFVRNIHDMSYSSSLQLHSAKRIIDIVDNIYQHSDPHVCRMLLIRILNCFVEKCESIANSVSGLVEKFKKSKHSESFSDVDETDLFDIIQMIHILIQGLKPTVWCITQSEIRPGVRIFGLQPEEAEVLGRFFDYSLECFQLHQALESDLMQTSKSPKFALFASKDILESFADVFSVLDTASFRRIFGQRLPFLFRYVSIYDLCQFLIFFFSF